MKKSFLILAIVAGLLLPVGAMAATEFSLGGFIKLGARVERQFTLVATALESGVGDWERN